VVEYGLILYLTGADGKSFDGNELSWWCYKK